MGIYLKNIRLSSMAKNFSAPDWKPGIRPPLYPFRYMQAGDAFRLTDKVLIQRAKNSAYQWNKNHPKKKIQTWSLGNGVIFYRKGVQTKNLPFGGGKPTPKKDRPSNE